MAKSVDTNHSRSFPTRSCCGTVLGLQIMLVFSHRQELNAVPCFPFIISQFTNKLLFLNFFVCIRVYALLHLKHQSQVICLARVFTSLIWFLNLLTTVALPKQILLDTCYCVRLLWEICKHFYQLLLICSLSVLSVIIHILIPYRYERTRADYIEKLPKGKHSCKGVGKSEPDPTESVTINDGVEIPLGKGITDVDKDSTLLYNEYPFLLISILLHIVYLLSAKSKFQSFFGWFLIYTELCFFSSFSKDFS